MPWHRKAFYAALCALLGLAGCAHNPAYSWSQDNLKRHDTATCPGAVFIAPQGNLVQCQASIASLLPQPDTYPKFDTMEEAAIAALKQIADKRGGTYEWGGVIGRSLDGKYAFTRPQTDFEGDNVQIHHSLPPDFDLVGGYHTHPCLPMHEVEYFSPEDLLAVIFGHEQVAFIGDFCTGNVHEFKRGDAPDSERVHDGLWLTKGRIVGTFTQPLKMAEL